MTDFKHSAEYLKRTDKNRPSDTMVRDLVALSLVIRETGTRLDSYALARIAHSLGKAGLLAEGDDLTVDTQAFVASGLESLEHLTQVLAAQNRIPLSREGYSEDGQLMLGYDGIPHAGVDTNELAPGTANVEPNPIPKTGY